MDKFQPFLGNIKNQDEFDIKKLKKIYEKTTFISCCNYCNSM